jgi:hypothetical protein
MTYLDIDVLITHCPYTDWMIVHVGLLTYRCEVSSRMIGHHPLRPVAPQNYLFV